MRVLSHQPDHAKVLQQLGWLYHQPGAHFADQEKAVSYLTKSLETDPSDAQSWYLLGRAYMAAQRYNKAYEAYQQAVYRDGRNPTFWCSIGVLYYQIAQYRDALDAYSRAIRLNPYISEVWYNLGSLYESCNNQMADAMDAYSRALELDPNNTVIKQRMALLQNPTGGPLPPVPPPIDVHPSQYTATPTAQPPAGSPNASPSHQLPSDAPAGGRDLPPPPPGGDIARGHSPGPFRNGAAPPPLNHVDEPRGPVPGMTQLARMESEPRPAELRDERYNGRYDPADIRRHNGSPLSPRASRRESQAFPSQPSYFPPKGAYARDREREEWDRSRGESRAPQEHSPRVGGRTPGADPRIPQEYRDYPGYYDPRAAYPPPLGGPPTPSAMAGRFDPRREAEEFRHREEDREVNGAKQASLMRQENRMPSPAPSIASSKNGRKRGEGTRKAKDKEEKAQNKKEGGRKGKAAGLKAGEEISGQSPRGNAKSPSVSVHNTPQLNTTRPIPPSAPAPVPLMSRTVDEGNSLFSLCEMTMTDYIFRLRRGRGRCAYGSCWRSQHHHTPPACSSYNPYSFRPHLASSAHSQCRSCYRSQTSWSRSQLTRTSQQTCQSREVSITSWFRVRFCFQSSAEANGDRSAQHTQHSQSFASDVFSGK